MKKLFLILILMPFLLQAQSHLLLFGKKAYINAWTPANLPIDTTNTSVIFYGEAPRTKVAKDSGGVSARPYMRMGINPATWDSVYGYSYTIPRPNDTTTYIYSQAIQWTQKDGDVIWIAAATDTVTVYPYIAPTPEPDHYYIVNKDGGKILMKGRVYAIKFKD